MKNFAKNVETGNAFFLGEKSFKKYVGSLVDTKDQTSIYIRPLKQSFDDLNSAKSELEVYLRSARETLKELETAKKELAKVQYETK